MSSLALLERLRDLDDQMRTIAAQRTQVDVFAAIGYQPTDRQREFHQAVEFDVLFGGAVGGGKTLSLVAEAIRRAATIPGLRALLLRRTYDELAESVWPALARFSYAKALGARWNGTERELTFPNRSIIRFRYAESLVDVSRRQGGEYQLLLVDEAQLLAPGIVNFLMHERLRSGGGVPVIGVRSTANPGGPSHGHIKARYIAATGYGQLTITDEDSGIAVRFIPSSARDNPHLDAGYLNRLDAIPDPARRAAMRDGDWDSFDGQVFTEWDPNRHVVPVFPVPVEWPRRCGIDYGYAAPWAALWAARDPDGRVWVYREMYARKVGAREQARRILEAERLAGDSHVHRVADPSMWAKTGDAAAFAVTYALEGCPLSKASNDRLAGWARLHQYLADGPACAHHREQGLTVCPMLHVLDGAAPNLVRTLPSAPYDPHRVEDVDTTSEDHALDALRYLVASYGGDSEIVFAPDDAPSAAAIDGSELLVPAGGGIAFSRSSWGTEALEPTAERFAVRRAPWAS